MKKLYIIAAMATATIAYADTPGIYHITQRNVSDLERKGSYCVISEDIVVDDEITLGYETTVIFDGGSFKGSGTVMLNYATIQADPYTIFDGVRVTGSLGNDRVRAIWFGRYGDDASVAINRALDIAPESIVEIGGATYTLLNPIVMNKNGQRINCTGTLRTVNDISAIEMSADNLGISLHNIEGNGAGTAVKLIRTSTSTISSDRVAGFGCGIDMSPYAPSGYAAVQYSKIDIGQIEADTAVLINPTDKVVTGNNVSIVSVTGGCGIYMKPSTDGQRRVSENVFTGISFENVKKPVTITGSMSDRFYDLKFDDNTIANSSSLISLSDTEHTEMRILGKYPVHKISNGNDLYHVIIDGIPTNLNGETVDMIDRVVMYSEGNGGTGASTLYLTKSTVATNMLNALTVNTSRTITAADLMANMCCARDAAEHLGYYFYQRMISNITTVNVTDYATLTIDLSGQPYTANDPIIVSLNCSEGTCRLKDHDGQTRTITSGTYILTTDTDGICRLERL